MADTATRPEIWSRIQSLMVERWGIESQNRLARDAKVGVATVSRIKSGSSSVGLDVIEKVAAALGVEAWQLICPPGRLADLAGHKSLSPLALDLAASLDRISDPDQHLRAYAVASQVLSFGAGPAAPVVRETATSPTQQQQISR